MDNLLILYIPLAVSLFYLFYLLIVPSKYGYSPMRAASEEVLTKLQKYIAPEREKLLLVNLTPEKATLNAISYGLLIGLVGAVMAFVITKSVNSIVVLTGMMFTVVGTVVGKYNTDQLFKKWQGELFEGIPVFVDFFPAFLEVEGIIPREALKSTLPFLPEPLHTELKTVYSRIERSGEVEEAFKTFADRAQHPIIDAICLRLSNTWGAKVEPDLFDDLHDEIINIKKEAADRRTVANKATLSLISVLGVLSVFSIFGYPALMFIGKKFGGF